jgi:outer membrane protein OmpA-like peptidoglycan-associated protein
LYRGDLRMPAAGAAPAGDPALQDVRKHLNTHSVQLLPWEFRSRSVNDLLDEVDRLERVIDPDSKSNPAAVAQAKTQLDGLRPYFAKLQSLGSYLWLYFRFNRALLPLACLSAGALLGLALFSAAVKPPTTTAAPQTGTVVIEQGCGKDACTDRGEASHPALPSFEPVHFELGKADVLSEQLAAVAAVRDWLRANPGTAVLLQAHTDTTAGTGINIALARQRADAVRTLLVDVGGVERNRIFTAELPKHALPVITGPETARSENRVVQFVPIRLPTAR